MSHQLIRSNDRIEEKPYLSSSGQPVNQEIPKYCRGDSALVKCTDGYGHEQIKNAAYNKPGMYGMIDGEAFNKTLKPYQMTHLMPSFDSGYVNPLCNPAEGCSTTASSSRSVQPMGIPAPYHGQYVAPEDAFPSCGPIYKGPGGREMTKSCTDSSARDPRLHLNKC